MSARVGDKAQSEGSTCCPPACLGCPHGWVGDIATGVQTINSILAARVTDTGPTNCPHGGTFMITKGSPDVQINNQKEARIGDEVVCQKCGGKGKIIPPCSPDTWANLK